MEGRYLLTRVIRNHRKAVEGYRSPRRFANTGAAGNSVRFWSAPVLWRFDSGRGMDDGRSSDLSLITPKGKSGRGLPQSKTLRGDRGRWEVRKVLECVRPSAFAGMQQVTSSPAQITVLRGSCSWLLDLRFLFRFRFRDFLPGWRAPRLPGRAGED